jgi:hypothetical protein
MRGLKSSFTFNQTLTPVPVKPRWYLWRRCSGLAIMDIAVLTTVEAEGIVVTIVEYSIDAEVIMLTMVE